jgi:hypothetical protein
MADFNKYSKSFDPIMLEGMTVNLFGTGLPEIGLPVRCLDVGSLPEYTTDFGAIVAGIWDEDNQDTNLSMPKGSFSQLRMKVVTDMKIRLKSPSSVRAWRSRDTGFYLPQYPFAGTDFDKEYMWRASEFFVWEDQSGVAFDLFSTVAQATTYVMFSGWRFSVEKLIGMRGKFDLWVNDWPSTRAK